MMIHIIIHYLKRIIHFGQITMPNVIVWKYFYIMTDVHYALLCLKKKIDMINSNIEFNPCIKD